MTQQPSVDISKLRELMNATFSLSEVRSLCTDLMDLGSDCDNLPGDTKQEKITGLISYLHHRNRLEQLLNRLKKDRPETKWDQVYLPIVHPPVIINGGGYVVSHERRRIFAIASVLAVVLSGIALLLVVRSGCLCTYQGEDDYETIEQIIRAESLAVTSGDLNIVSDIFAPDAYLKQTDNEAGSVTEWFDPISHYRALFATTQFSEARHTRITGVVNGSYARFTSGSQGVYVRNGEHGEYDHPAGDPNEEEVWTLEKNFWGCWEITRFEFH